MSTQLNTPVLVALIGIVGVLIGVIARPIVENFVNRRRDQVAITLGKKGKIKASPGFLSLHLDDQELMKIQDYVPTKVINGKNTALKDYKIVFESRRRHRKFLMHCKSAKGVEWTAETSETGVMLNIAHFPANSTLECYIFFDWLFEIDIFSKEDVPLVVIRSLRHRLSFL